MFYHEKNKIIIESIHTHTHTSIVNGKLCGDNIKMKHVYMIFERLKHNFI